MKSLRAAAWCTLLLVLLNASSLWVSTNALSLLGMRPGVELALPWRSGLALSNLHIRYAPLLSIGAIALAAIVGAVVERKRSIAGERRVLAAWLLVAAAAGGIELAAALWWRAGAGGLGVPAVRLLLLVDPILYLGLVAFVAAAVVAARLQSRLHALGARVRGWHVAVATCALSVLGPAGFLPPVVVWVYTGRADPRGRRAAQQGDRAAEPRKEDGS